MAPAAAGATARSRRLRRLFDAVDTDHSGGVSRLELRNALRAGGVWATDQRLDALFRSMDANADGSVSFDEFCRAFDELDTPELRGLHAAVEGAAAACASPDKPVIPETGDYRQQLKFLAAGCSAGLLSKTAVAPLERLVVQRQCDPGSVLPMRLALSDIARREGVLGLWKGNFIACLRQVPFAGLVCFFYTVLTKQVLEIPPSVSLGDEGGGQATALRLSAGALSGAFAATLTYPLEVLKTRVQVAGAPGVREVAAQMRSPAAGRGVLFRGLTPTLWTVAPFVAVDKAAHAVLRDKAAEKGWGGGAGVILACGALSGLVGQTVVHSVDVVRKRMQAGQDYTNVRDAVRRILNTEGAGGFAKGLLAAYCKAAPAMAVTYATIDATVRFIEREVGDES
eukprot:TRINITY_DN31555_c0_g1_i1.p1 TRINITY_DN31555_c0_g1~~TRINITY_DN31555_c0_g1_i1.p1  ORF type:complete len:426 (+),score=129.86 TRINITY_DN31555_c0_g1_i1:90-1280(+)